MSSGSALAASHEFCNLKYISGERGEGGVVVKGYEKAIEKSPNQYFIDMQYMMLKKLFNLHQYDACLEILNNLRAVTGKREEIEKMEKYEKVVRGYSLWDKFNHEEARKILADINRDFIDNGNNKRFLNEIFGAAKEGMKEEAIIPDLINNIGRRIKESKYDDAVARAYRCVEMMAQYRLRKKYGLDASNIDTMKLKSELNMDWKIVEKYERMRGRNGRIQLALKKDLELLQDLGDGMGVLLDDKAFMDLLEKRNSSILAHGIKPVTKEMAEKFYNKVVEIGEKFFDDMGHKYRLSEIREMARFPEL